MIVGAVVGIAAALAGAKLNRGDAVAAAWGIALGMGCQLIPEAGRAPAQLIAMIAAGIGAALLSSPMAGIGLVAVVLTDSLGKLGSSSDLLPMCGTVFGAVALVTIAVCVMSKGKAVFATVVGTLLPIVLGLALGWFWLKDNSYGISIALGALAGLVLNAILPSATDRGAGQVTLGVLISVALATVTFSLARGTGMALTFFGAFTVLAVVGNMRAILVLGPLLGIALFRAFRTIHPELGRGFDIGQHYAILGLLLGMFAPLVLSDWQAKTRTGVIAAVALGIWGIVFMVLPPFVAVFFATFGAAGFALGTGLSGSIEALRGSNSASTVSLGAGMSVAMIVSFGWLVNSLDLARDDKVRILMYVAGGLAIIAIVLAGLTKASTRSQEVK
jgi:hypothetical protein